MNVEATILLLSSFTVMGQFLFWVCYNLDKKSFEWPMAIALVFNALVALAWAMFILLLNDHTWG